MIDASIWQPLQDELKRWAGSQREVRFWLRDDDAVESSQALEQLLVLGSGHGVPITLAVVPAYAGAPLAQRLADEGGVTVAVHGWSHKNHAPAGQKKQELGAHRPRDLVIAELQSGLVRLRELFPQHLVPMLVPPWNRIDPLLLPELPCFGFEALSVFGPSKNTPSTVLVINTHIDLMDWHGTRGCRDHGELVAAIVGEMQHQFQSGNGEAIGILTHHLVHDESAWDFLRVLFAIVSETKSSRWVSVRELLPGNPV